MDDLPLKITVKPLRCRMVGLSVLRDLQGFSLVALILQKARDTIVQGPESAWNRWNHIINHI